MALCILKCMKHLNNLINNYWFIIYHYVYEQIVCINIDHNKIIIDMLDFKQHYINTTD